MIRTAYEQRGEFSAAVELRQLFLASTMYGEGVRADDRRLEAAVEAATPGEIAPREDRLKSSFPSAWGIVGQVVFRQYYCLVSA